MRAKIDVDVDIDKAELASASIASKLSGLTKNFPSFGSGVNPAGYAVIAGLILAWAAPIVGILTTALLSLPGILSLVLAPIAAITLGLDGFKKAALTVKPQFESLKKIMADAAQTSFTPVFQNLANTIFPLLER